MTPDLQAAVQRLTCTFCLDNGALHHRIANSSEAAQRVRKALHDTKLAVHHIDGDPTNNSPENLTIVRWDRNFRAKR